MTAIKPASNFDLDSVKAILGKKGKCLDAFFNAYKNHAPAIKFLEEEGVDLFIKGCKKTSTKCPVPSFKVTLSDRNGKIEDKTFSIPAKGVKSELFNEVITQGMVFLSSKLRPSSVKKEPEYTRKNLVKTISKGLIENRFKVIDAQINSLKKQGFVFPTKHLSQYSEGEVKKLFSDNKKAMAKHPREITESLISIASQLAKIPGSLKNL